jgi:hypothetical protein
MADAGSLEQMHVAGGKLCRVRRNVRLLMCTSDTLRSLLRLIATIEDITGGQCW